MKCPNCGGETGVIDSRVMSEGVRRRRQCNSCGFRFSTMERVIAKALFVVKKDGRREVFQREKLLTGIRKACEKRPLPIGTIEKMVDEIEEELFKMGKKEVPSYIIGDMVMERLKKIDHIAYIRFASVYRQFPDLASLKEAVNSLAQGETLPTQPPLDLKK